jgi:hypothetical protein
MNPSCLRRHHVLAVSLARKVYEHGQQHGRTIALHLLAEEET